jgi:uncharacterized repeat protein (TIGR01451 family)
VSLSTTNLSFGQVNLGSTGTQTVTVSNTGNADLSISDIVLGGTNRQEFSWAYGGYCWLGLAPGANCPINVWFSPGAAGSRSASLSITDNAPGSPQTVSLTGTGVLAPTPAGTYAVLVQATSGSDVHQLDVDVNVQ